MKIELSDHTLEVLKETALAQIRQIEQEDDHPNLKIQPFIQLLNLLHELEHYMTVTRRRIEE